MQSMAATTTVPELADRLDSVIGNINDTIRQIRTRSFSSRTATPPPQASVRSCSKSSTRSLWLLVSRRPFDSTDPWTPSSPPPSWTPSPQSSEKPSRMWPKASHATQLDVELIVDLDQITVDVSNNGVRPGSHRQSASKRASTI